LTIQSLNRELSVRGLPLLSEEDPAPPGKTTCATSGGQAGDTNPESSITFGLVHSYAPKRGNAVETRLLSL